MVLSYTLLIKCSTCLLLDEEFLSGFICFHVFWSVSVQQLAALSLAKVRVQTELDRDTLLTPTEQTTS